MQLWLRKYNELYLINALSNERIHLSSDGIHIEVLFEKGDRLKWTQHLLNRILFLGENKGWRLKQIFVRCINQELYQRNWCKHIYGVVDSDVNGISKLFLELHTKGLGMPLTWFLNEWSSLPTPKSYHVGLFRRYQHLIGQTRQQMLARGKFHLTYRDPVMTNCTDYKLEYDDSSFIHLSSDDLLSSEYPAYCTNPNMEARELSFKG